MKGNPLSLFKGGPLMWDDNVLPALCPVLHSDINPFSVEEVSGFGLLPTVQ